MDELDDFGDGIVNGDHDDVARHGLHLGRELAAHENVGGHGAQNNGLEGDAAAFVSLAHHLENLIDRELGDIITQAVGVGENVGGGGSADKGDRFLF